MSGSLTFNQHYAIPIIYSTVLLLRLLSRLMLCSRPSMYADTTTSLWLVGVAKVCQQCLHFSQWGLFAAAQQYQNFSNRLQKLLLLHMHSIIIGLNWPKMLSNLQSVFSKFFLTLVFQRWQMIMRCVRWLLLSKLTAECADKWIVKMVNIWLVMTKKVSGLLFWPTCVHVCIISPTSGQKHTVQSAVS